MEGAASTRRIVSWGGPASQPLNRTHEPHMAMAAAAAAASSAPTGAGELEGLVQETVSFLGGLWSSGSGKDGAKQRDDKIGESAGRAAFEDFDMLVRASWGGAGWGGWNGRARNVHRSTSII